MLGPSLGGAATRCAPGAADMPGWCSSAAAATSGVTCRVLDISYHTLQAYLGEEGVVRQVEDPAVADSSSPAVGAGEERLS